VTLCELKKKEHGSTPATKSFFRGAPQLGSKICTKGTIGS